ncbi:hypothetical protein ACFE04_028984 [Oxalis oulophora]
MAEARKVEFDVKKHKPTYVTPAEETNKGLYFLSNTDQLKDVIVCTIYCFKSDTKGNEDACEVIKKALSKILVHYYPLAGRLTTNSEGEVIVDCTADGALFVEAEANCEIKEITKLENTLSLGVFVYDVPGDHQNIFQIPPLIVQVARGLPLKLPPFMDRTILKSRNPPKIEFQHKEEFDEIEDISNTKQLYQEELMLSRSTFYFDSEKLERLKKSAMKGGVVQCTTFEVLVAFIWKSKCQALGMHPDQQIKLIFSVDVRKRLVPPIPQGYFSNAFVQAIKFIVQCKALQPWKGHLLITTWSRLDLNMIDFGWGKAILSGPVGWPKKEIVIFLSERKGISVVLGLPASAMKIFEDLINQTSDVEK